MHICPLCGLEVRDLVDHLGAGHAINFCRVVGERKQMHLEYVCPCGWKCNSLKKLRRHLEEDPEHLPAAMARKGILRAHA